MLIVTIHRIILTKVHPEFDLSTFRCHNSDETICMKLKRQDRFKTPLLKN